MPSINSAQVSLLADPLALPVLSFSDLGEDSSALIFAPHPDDESLGCGGLIAGLRQMNTTVRVIFLSDGTGSHPNSRRYPANRLKALREQEALRALARLGVNPTAVSFLGWPDTAVPTPGQSGFAQAVQRCRAEIEQSACALVVTPWRRDPHCDHRATWQIVQAAFESLAQPPRLLEYPIWIWEGLAEQLDTPRSDEVRGWRLDISAVLPQKLAAIGEHRSQITNLIDDDPAGFRLTPQTLALFARPWEYFLEGNL